MAANIQRQAKISRVIYRQLLRWCDRTGTIPFDPIPPVTLSPPLVNKALLQQLSADDTMNNNYNINTSNKINNDDKNDVLKMILLNNAAVVQQSKIVMPVYDSSSLRDIIRVAYRLSMLSQHFDHQESNDDDDTKFNDAMKKRVNLSFEAIKALNELSVGMLEERKRERDHHIDRSGVLFHIGQVVRHKKERWRGIVSGWRKEHNEKEGKVLTHYSLILDAGDAHLFNPNLSMLKLHPGREQGQPYMVEPDLESVKEPCLARIRSPSTEGKFTSFDSTDGHFVPSPILSYEYPFDSPPPVVTEDLPSFPVIHDAAELARVSHSVEMGIRSVSSHLQDLVMKSSDDVISNALVSSFLDHLSDICTGKVEPISTISAASATNNRKHTKTGTIMPSMAAAFLKAFGELNQELSEVLHLRQIALQNKHKLRFSLGQIVKHKVYGFRGVIVAWDPKPKVDVSRWDGLRNVHNASHIPFYLVMPDQNDCVKAFGSERSFRYVCEENLDLCPDKERLLSSVDLDDGWSFDKKTWKYLPPQDAMFKYAEDMGPNENDIVACIENLKQEISCIFLAIKNNNFSHNENDGSDDNGTSQPFIQDLSMENLFALLRGATRWIDAVTVEDTIKEVWKSHNDPVLRFRLDDAMKHLFAGRRQEALTVLTEIVNEDPNYFEAWNKKATCHFLRGEMDPSKEATEKTLDLEPNHFQALVGLGLIEKDKQNNTGAATYFRQSIDLNPWSQVSSSLGPCIDVIEATIKEGPTVTDGTVSPNI